MTNIDSDKITFEEALEALEGVVQKLESGAVPLDDSISLYEEGQRLRKLCQARLDDAKVRIDRIVTDSKANAEAVEKFDQGD